MGLSGPDAIPADRASEAVQQAGAAHSRGIRALQDLPEAQGTLLALGHPLRSHRVQRQGRPIRNAFPRPTSFRSAICKLPARWSRPACPPPSSFRPASRPTFRNPSRIAASPWPHGSPVPTIRSTVRVIVNRIWGWHFGHGIVATPNDFGKLGKRPTHPELLDWLCATISSTTAGASRKCTGSSCSPTPTSAIPRPPSEAALKADPEAALLSYFPPRRLDAEEILDSMLADVRRAQRRYRRPRHAARDQPRRRQSAAADHGHADAGVSPVAHARRAQSPHGLRLPEAQSAQPHDGCLERTVVQRIDARRATPPPFPRKPSPC